jgi:UDP-2,4-diacetamido-2,4,6-trideoxy-beta-L-altropyranose hydrolase
MRVAIRADASATIGAGHVMRCRSLAGALRARGADILFICRDHPGNLGTILRADGYEVCMLPAPGPVAAPPMGSGDYAAWLGGSEEQDAEETVAALAAGADWVVADHYALSPLWENIVRSGGRKLLAMDDLGRHHAADILLDQNFSLDPEARYRGRLNANCQTLLGPRFALLHQAYADSARTPRPTNERVRRIFVFYGGADPSGMTLKTLTALAHPAFSEVAIDVVVGPMNPHASAIAALASQRANIVLHAPRPTLVELLERADLALGAGGGNTWERCCLGVPAIVVSIADNQVPASKDLDRLGVIHYLGPDAAAREHTIRDAVSTLAANAAMRDDMATKGRQLTDGRGAERVAELLLPTDIGKLRLRPARAEDAPFYFHLVNDPEVRRQSFNSAPVLWQNHLRWLESKLGDPSARLLVLEAAGLPVGQIRFDIADRRANIDYSLDPWVRGRGWGAALMERGLQAIAEEPIDEVTGHVKRENLGSCAVFEKLGFKSLHDETDDKAHFSMNPVDLRGRYSRRAPHGPAA